MQRKDEKSQEEKRLQRQLRNKRAELERQRNGFFGDLDAHPDEGWHNNTSLMGVMAKIAEKASKPGTFIGQGETHLTPMAEPAKANNLKAKERRQRFNEKINKIVNGEPHQDPITKEEKQPPYYFFVMPRSNHFVLVKVAEGGDVTHYNEKDGKYDADTVKLLKDLGFTENKIAKHSNSDKKHKQPDSWSCGDRALRNLCELMSIKLEITAQETSADLRKCALAIYESLFDKKENVRELKAEIKQLEKQLADAGKKPEEVTPNSIISCAEEIKTAPDLRQNFLGDKHRNKIITNLEKKGWEHIEHKTGDKITSVDFQKTGEPDSKFTLYENSLQTNSNSVDTFQAMLEVFKTAHPNKEPSVQTDTQACAKLWDQAYEKVFGKPAPENFASAKESAENNQPPQPPRP